MLGMLMESWVECKLDTNTSSAENKAIEHTLNESHLLLSIPSIVK